MMSERHTTCNAIGCTNAPTHRAEIVIYAAVTRLHPPAIGYLGLCVCAEHATPDSAAELLTDEAKQTIANGFTRIGRARPDWSRSFVRWVPMVKGK